MKKPCQKHCHKFLGLLTVHTYNLETVSISKTIMELHVEEPQQQIIT